MPRFYTHEEVLQIVNAAQKKPGLWKRMKRGAFIGAVIAGLSAGYKDDEIMTFLQRHSNVVDGAKKVALGAGIGAVAGSILRRRKLR